MSEPTQPQSCFDCGCPLAGKAKGFTLGCGDPTRAKYAIVLEAPGKEEVSFTLTPNPNRAFLQTKEECDKELAIRRRDYPQLDDRWLRLGVPVVGPTGLALQHWIWKKVGLRRDEFYIDNTIRCLYKSKDKVYPIGDEKKAAERCCRQYDRLQEFFVRNPATKAMRVLSSELPSQIPQTSEDSNLSLAKNKILQQELRTTGTDGGEKEVKLAGRSDVTRALPRDIFTESSAREQQQICPGTSVGDGKTFGQVSQSDRSSTPQEWNKDGQPNRESGVSTVRGTSRSSELSPLPKDIPDPIAVAIVSLHPASLLREITPLPLAIKDFEKLRDFGTQNVRSVMLLGGKAVHAFLRYGSNVTRWRGHYTALASDWCQTYKGLFEYSAKGRKKKVSDPASDFFGVPESVVQRARDKERRPEELAPGRCKQWKRHTHKHPPKCAHDDCWSDYEIAVASRQKSDNISFVTGG